MEIKAWFGKNRDQLLVIVIGGLILAAVLALLATISSLATSEGLWSFLGADIPLPFWVLVTFLGASFVLALLWRHARNRASALTVETQDLQSLATRERAEFEAQLHNLTVDCETLRAAARHKLNASDTHLTSAAAVVKSMMGDDQNLRADDNSVDVAAVIRNLGDEGVRVDLEATRKATDDVFKLTGRRSKEPDEPNI